MSPFHRQVGIELTFVPDRRPNFKEGDFGFSPSTFCDLIESYSKLLSAYGVDAQSGGCRGERSWRNWGWLGVDPGCIEWSSPILHSWDEARSWYQFALDTAEQVGLTPWHPKQVGGMGHVHMQMTHGQALRVMRDLKYRPWLSWVFAEPVQNYYCQSLANPGLFSMHQLVRFQTEFGTLEWRGFDSACEWEEQEEHLAFYQAYVQYVLGNPNLKHRGTPVELARYFRDKDEGLGRCIGAFRQLIVEELGLPWARYEWYTELHLPRQFEWGDLL